MAINGDVSRLQAASDAPGNGLDSLSVILASASPRRRELLDALGIHFRVMVSDFDESTLAHLTDPVEYVTRAAREKACSVAPRCDQGLIIGCDTDVVSPGGRILGKPLNEDEARFMLNELSAKTHRVYSSLCMLRVAGGVTIQQAERLVRTEVTFRALRAPEIDAYLRTGEYADKAGAYGIQGRAAALVERVEGDLTSVIGLPIPALMDLFTDFNVSPWAGAAMKRSEDTAASV